MSDEGAPMTRRWAFAATAECSTCGNACIAAGDTPTECEDALRRCMQAHMQATGHPGFLQPAFVGPVETGHEDA